MIADSPSSIPLSSSRKETGAGNLNIVRNGVLLPIYSPKRGFGTLLFVITLGKQVGSETRPAPP